MLCRLFIGLGLMISSFRGLRFRPNRHFCQVCSSLDMRTDTISRLGTISRRYYISRGSPQELPNQIPPATDEAGMPKQGLLWPMSGWYEDLIAHAFLYSVLVLAYEDIDRSAFALYDARAEIQGRLRGCPVRNGRN